MYIDRGERVAVIAQCYESQKTKTEAPANKASDLSTAIGWLLNAEESTIYRHSLLDRHSHLFMDTPLWLTTKRPIFGNATCGFSFPPCSLIRQTGSGSLMLARRVLVKTPGP